MGHATSQLPQGVLLLNTIASCLFMASQARIMDLELQKAVAVFQLAGRGFGSFSTTS